MSRTMSGAAPATQPSRPMTPPHPLPVPRAPGGRRRLAWQPPGGRRRLMISAVVLAAALAIARWLPVRRDLYATQIAGAREVIAYELAAGQPIEMALPPGTELVRILSNLDVPPDAPDDGTPYLLRVRVPEENRDDSFPLLARPPRDERGRATAFFLRRSGSPARTRILTLARASTRPATLQVSLQAPGTARASLRVLVAHERLARETSAAARPGRLVGAGRLALEELAPELRDAFTSQRWSRLSARNKTPTRSFYLVGDASPPRGHERPTGQPLAAGQVLAYTVKGPGTLELQALAGPLAGRLALLDDSGGSRVRPIRLPAEGQLSVPVGAGLQTLRLDSDGPATVRVLASAPQMITTPEPRRPLAGGDELEVEPGWSRQTLARTQRGGPPVAYDLEGRREAPVRVSVRIPLPAAGPKTLLRWHFTDGQGRGIKHGELPLLTTPAPEDRLQTAAGPTAVSEPTVFYLWPPPGAHWLMFDSDHPASVAVASPGFDQEVPAAPDPARRSVVLRYSPGERRPFYAFQAANAQKLRQAGRIDRFEGAFRLEVPPPPEKPPGDAESLYLTRDGGRFALIEPLAERTLERRPGRLWALAREREEAIIIPQPAGASRRARVPATLVYQVERLQGPQVLTVRLDGQVVRRASVLATRGQIALPPLPVGKHRLRIDLPAAGRFFLDQPVSGAPAYRKTRVSALQTEVVSVTVPKGTAARALGVVVYLDGPPVRPDTAEVEAVVDGGVRQRRGAPAWSRFYTRLRRRTALRFSRASGAIYLDRAGGDVWTSTPIFIRLGDDLGPGPHQIALRLRGLGPHPAARFFAYGGRALSRINQHIEMRAEVSP